MADPGFCCAPSGLRLLLMGLLLLVAELETAFWSLCAVGVVGALWLMLADAKRRI
ncbi:MAG: hypothetical protein WD073_09450 [Xanthobacteraceae bacterium]